MVFSEDDLPGFTPRERRRIQQAALTDTLLVLLFFAILASTFIHFGTPAPEQFLCP